MNIAVSYSIRVAENMLNMSQGNVLYLQGYQGYIIFKTFFCFLMTSLHLLKYVQSILFSRPGE